MTHRFRQHLRADAGVTGPAFPGGPLVQGLSRLEPLATDAPVGPETPPARSVEGAAFARARTFDARRTRILLPEPYEPNYAYPLVVWFHDAGGSERELPRVMTRISTQNYLGLSLRGPIPCGETLSAGFRWPGEGSDLEGLLGDLRAIVGTVRREWHVHSERIVLAGHGEGATLALRLLLARPEWFFGAVALSARLPKSHATPHAFREEQGKPVLLGVGAQDPRASVGDVVQTGRVLHAAGLKVATRVFDGACDLTPELGREVDRWIMEELLAPV
jgi:phospholipase/carboxylesterase